MHRVLLTDGINISERNFPTLFSAMKDLKCEVFKENLPFEYIAAYGNYRGHRKIVQITKGLKSLSKDELFFLQESRVNLFRLVKAEMLTFLTVNKGLFENGIPQDDRLLFDYAWNNSLLDLQLNIAAGQYWINYWKDRIRSLPVLHSSVVFSGSSIYQKAFIEMIKHTQCRNFVVETSLTGHDYYFEEKYDHIANNSDIRFDGIYNKSIEKNSADVDQMNRTQVKALNKLNAMNNKNVTQPAVTDNLSGIHSTKVALIGQVVNDYSVLESGIHTIDFYKRFLTAFADKSVDVIIKVHPWEHKKTNLNCAFTKNILEQFIEDDLAEANATYQIIEDYNIEHLFSQVDYIAGLNTQSLIEAAKSGLKPAQFGNAFYGRKGFTYDFELNEIERFVSLVDDNRLGTLDLKEYQSFLEFTSVYLVDQLVSVNPSGKNEIRRRMTGYQEIPKTVPTHASPAQAETLNIEDVSAMAKKLRKFERDKHGFFRDSKSPILRPLKHLFPA